MSALLEVKGLSVGYARKGLALEDVSLSVPKGGIVALLVLWEFKSWRVTLCIMLPLYITSVLCEGIMAVLGLACPSGANSDTERGVMVNPGVDERGMGVFAILGNDGSDAFWHGESLETTAVQAA